MVALFRKIQNAEFSYPRYGHRTIRSFFASTRIRLTCSRCIHEACPEIFMSVSSPVSNPRHICISASPSLSSIGPVCVGLCSWFSPEVRSLLDIVLVADPARRATVPQVRQLPMYLLFMRKKYALPFSGNTAHVFKPFRAVHTSLEPRQGGVESDTGPDPLLSCCVAAEGPPMVHGRRRVQATPTPGGQCNSRSNMISEPKA